MIDKAGHSPPMEERLRAYLKEDEGGIRLAMMSILLDADECTTRDLHKLLTDNGFDRPYRGVCAMLGAMNSKLGVLTTTTRSRSRTYNIKPSCRELICYVMENYQSSGSEAD